MHLRPEGMQEEEAMSVVEFVLRLPGGVELHGESVPGSDEDESVSIGRREGEELRLSDRKTAFIPGNKFIEAYLRIVRAETDDSTTYGEGALLPEDWRAWEPLEPDMQDAKRNQLAFEIVRACNELISMANANRIESP
jgi:hypothetical protein